MDYTGVTLACIDVMSDRKATVSDVHVHIGDFIYDAQGSSWRMKTDKYDEDTGNLIATYRALQRIMSQMERDVKKIRNGS